VRLKRVFGFARIRSSGTPISTFLPVRRPAAASPVHVIGRAVSSWGGRELLRCAPQFNALSSAIPNENTMQYMLMPLEAHFDGGLGATGDAFEEAAKKLAESAAELPSSHPHLPINFLHRHAVELYLKSMIVVMHRARSEST
jgi:hypothetical protein